MVTPSAGEGVWTLAQTLDITLHPPSSGATLVAIARSLALNPKVVLLDEVTAALDPETVKEVLSTIRELAEEGMTLLIVTHEMGFAREVANRIVFMDAGVVVEDGTPDKMFKAAEHGRTREFLDKIL